MILFFTFMFFQKGIFTYHISLYEREKRAEIRKPEKKIKIEEAESHTD